jgi:hypothetical protein
VCNCAVGFDYGRVQPAARAPAKTVGGAPDEHHPDDHDDEQGKDEAVLLSCIPSSDGQAAASATNGRRANPSELHC